MDAPPLRAEHRLSTDESSERWDRGATRGFIAWANRHNPILTGMAAVLVPVLYLLFVNHYAINSLYGDDWSVAPLVHAALHGHLSLSQLWGQYNESRLFFGNIIEVLFGVVDRFDVRAVVLFNAALFIASYALLMALFRRYAARRLTPIPVLLIGVIWFSLADVQNSLWAFQVSWYLTVFWFMVMLFALLMPASRRALWLTLAVLAAVAASLTTLQGFILWPLGLLCIFWTQPSGRRVFLEAAGWLGTMIVTISLYLPGYRSSNNGCFPSAHCSPQVALHHPLRAVEFFFALIGNVIPGGFPSPTGNTARFEAVGAALFTVALFVLVQSWRHRASGEHMPLPLLLISFSLIFDVFITLGRSVAGPSGALVNNRYVMANLILFTGIVIYMLPHIRLARSHSTKSSPRVSAHFLLLGASVVFLLFQATVATEFGLTNGRTSSEIRNENAQVLVNQGGMPAQFRTCELYVALFAQAGASSLRIREATADKLAEFRPSSYRYFRKLGPPAPFPACSKYRQPVRRHPKTT